MKGQKATDVPGLKPLLESGHGATSAARFDRGRPCNAGCNMRAIPPNRNRSPNSHATFAFFSVEGDPVYLQCIGGALSLEAALLESFADERRFGVAALATPVATAATGLGIRRVARFAQSSSPCLSRMGLQSAGRTTMLHHLVATVACNGFFYRADSDDPAALLHG
jgi:hypothetical protein